jgi:hypothetical protein
MTAALAHSPMLTESMARINRKVDQKLFPTCPIGQVWTCLECGTQRAWGLCQPFDATIKPALCCDGCHDITRHAYLGTKGISIAC